MSHLAIAMLAIMVICEAEDETADMTFAGLLRGAEKTCQLKDPSLRAPSGGCLSHCLEMENVYSAHTHFKFKVFNYYYYYY